MVRRASGRGYAAWAPTPKSGTVVQALCGGGCGWDPSEEGPGLALEVGALGMRGHGEEILRRQDMGGPRPGRLEKSPGP